MPCPSHVDSWWSQTFLTSFEPRWTEGDRAEVGGKGEGRTSALAALGCGEHHPHEVECEIGMDVTARGHSADAVRTEPRTAILTACVAVHTAGVR